MARVRSITSPRLILGFVVISFAAALAGALYWDTVFVSGTLFWSVNVDPVRGRGRRKGAVGRGTEAIGQQCARPSTLRRERGRGGERQKSRRMPCIRG